MDTVETYQQQLLDQAQHIYYETPLRAAETIESLGIENVDIISADGGAGYLPGAPYDRAIFTAGAYDLPHHFSGGSSFTVRRRTIDDSAIVLRLSSPEPAMEFSQRRISP
jgi:hypothetical protein